MKFHYLVISLLVIPQASNARVNATPPSSVHVRKFTATGRTPMSLLSDIARKYHLIIGLYGTGKYSDWEAPKTIDVDVKDGTLADVFDVISRAGGFEWRRNSSGAVHFKMHGTTLTLMEVMVRSFDDENPQWPEIRNRLRTVPEVASWLQDHKCPVPNEEIYIAGHPPTWRKFSIHVRDLPMSSMLDQIAAQSGTYYWRAAEIHQPDMCYLTIRWWL